MSTTTTKPKPARAATNGDPVSAARRHINSVKRQVADVLAEEDVNRSTRVQRAQRIKAEGFERVAEILSGRARR